MKPLPTVPLTPEDFWIWDSVVHRCGGEGIAYKLATLHADRRDAELMSKAQCMRGAMLPDKTHEVPLFGRWYLVRGGADLTRDWSPLFDLT